MFAILIALISPIAHGVVNIIDAHVSGNVFKKIPTLCFYAAMTNLLAIPFILFFGFPQFVPSYVWPWIILAAFLDFLYVFPYFTALRYVDTSIVAAMFSLGKVILPILAYLMVGEKLNEWQYVGFFIIIAANLALNINDPKAIKINKGFWLMLLASLALSLQAVVYKKILINIDWVTTAIYTTLIGDILFLSMFLIPMLRQDILASFSTFRKNFKLLITVEVFDRLGAIPMIAAFSMLPVVVAEGIFSTQAIFVLLFGVVLYLMFGDKFKEDVSKNNLIKKIVCFLFIIIGVAMVVR